MRSIKQLVLALALIGSVGAATASVPVQATGGGSHPIVVGDLSVYDEWSLYHSAIVGSFSDSIDFTLPVASDFSWFVHTFYQKAKSDITALSVTLDGNPLTVLPSGKFEFSDGELVLGGAPHTLIISGIGSGSSGGAYSLLMSASPVPEPAGYAMWAAGIGLVGVVGTLQRRRRKPQA